MSIFSIAGSFIKSAATDVVASYGRILEYAALGSIIALSGYLGWHLNGMRYMAKIEATQIADQQNVIAAQKSSSITEHKDAAITLGVSYEFQKNLADINARYDSMLANGQAKTAASDNMPKSAASTARADGPSCNFTLSLKRNAEVQTAQLVAFQSWACKQKLAKCK